MADTERPYLKQIRISKDVCDRLDKRKAKGDSYTDVVKALLVENARLTQRCEELERDKENLTIVSKAIAVQMALYNPKLYNAMNMNEFHVEEDAPEPFKPETHDEAISRAVNKTIKDLNL